MTERPANLQSERRPGDLLLDRFFPDADVETRERAREVLRAYARILLRLGTRLHEDALHLPDSQERGDGVIL